MVKTVKLKLLTTPEQSDQLMQVSLLYRNVCQYISNWIFGNGFILNFMTLQKELYHEIREKFPLNSQMTISALKTTTARYKTVNEQLFQNPFKYKDGKDKDGKDIWHYIPKTLKWLQKPIHFSAPQCDQVRNRNYRLLQDGRISLTTLQGTVKVAYQAPACWQKRLDDGWVIGTAKLVYQRKQWYLCVPMKIETEEIPRENIQRIVGIDCGLNFIVATADNEGKSFFKSGRQVLHIRHKFASLRKRLQEHNTHGSKRKIKAIGHRENRWMSDVNHQISKALVEQYGSNTLFVLEDLTGVTFEEENLRGSEQDRQDKRTWAFYQFEQFLTYKAEAVGSKVIKVSAKYTSQRCPRCGVIDKSQRDHKTHEYRCHCGYRTNDDRIGALNLLELGRRYLNGEDKPKFRKSKSISVAR